MQELKMSYNKNGFCLLMLKLTNVQTVYICLAPLNNMMKYGNLKFTEIIMKVYAL